MRKRKGPDTSQGSGGRAGESRTVQEYIDETPIWPDGTVVPFAPMTSMQWRIWCLATAGKFFEGLVVFMTGVALPLIVLQFGLTPVEKGVVSAATLMGILIGASVLGGLADYLGRKLMFICEMFIFTAFLALLVVTPSYVWLLVCLFGMGLALGCDYPTAHMVISESIPSRMRGKLVLSAFGFQALGAMAGTAVGYLILYENPHLSAWRWMYGTAVIPAMLVTAGRFFVPQSGHWLVCRGRLEEAQRELARLLNRRPPYPQTIRLAPPPEPDGAVEPGGGGYRSLFQGKNLRATILASVPWFLQDLGTYGIGIFTPTILANVIGAKTQYAGNLVGVIHNDLLAAKGAAFIDVLLLVGIVAAVLLVERVGRIRLQVMGFVGCALGLGLASLSAYATGPHKLVLIFSGFMLFSFMTNLGPNAMTYLIAGEVFPTRIRGKGAGLAASFAKIGAVATAFLFPVLLRHLGTQTLLCALVISSLLGAAVTWILRIETSGMNLESVGEAPRPASPDPPPGSGR